MDGQKFYKGFHYTGDLGTWDKNEFVTVVSRKDDMIIVAGENIYPTQIEAILNEHPKVAECAVVGRPHRLHGQCVAAYIVSADESLTVEELRNYCVNHKMLSPFKRPKYFTLVKELPPHGNRQVAALQASRPGCRGSQGGRGKIETVIIEIRPEIASPGGACRNASLRLRS